MSLIFPNKETNSSLAKKYSLNFRSIRRTRHTLDRVLNFLNISNQSVDFKPKIKPIRTNSSKRCEGSPYPHFLIKDKWNSKLTIKNIDLKPMKLSKISITKTQNSKRDTIRSYKVFKIPLDVDMWEKKQIDQMNSLKKMSKSLGIKKSFDNKADFDLRNFIKNPSPKSLSRNSKQRTKSNVGFIRPVITIDREIQLSNDNSEDESHFETRPFITYDEYDKNYRRRNEEKIAII